MLPVSVDQRPVRIEPIGKIKEKIKHKVNIVERNYL